MSPKEQPRLTPPAPISVLDEMTQQAARRPHPAPAAVPAQAEPAAEPAPAPAAAAPAVPRKATTTRAAKRAPAPRQAGTSARPSPAGGAAAGEGLALDVPIPDRVTKGADVPLQVRIPLGDHWKLKTQTFLRGTNMKRIVSALLSVYTDDPELCEALIEQAEAQGVSLGAFLHEAHADIAAA